MLYSYNLYRIAFKNMPALLQQIGELKKEMDLIKNELEIVKNQKCTHGVSEINTEEIFNEIHERATRSRNLIIYNVKELGCDELLESIEDDKKVVQEVFETLNIRPSIGGVNKFEKVLRICRKKEYSCRPLKGICADPLCD
ncbi:unnamed protein product [Psylliodes chrysocephalus]|uniref:Uncharacterized protein n=1 Tax=Psylliodes chrysocephalus TaxID=3402493 RepID=A0A9P0CE60_9CUCU|nr:unnamed protein product [Psylliodes chrysocephala]